MKKSQLQSLMASRSAMLRRYMVSRLAPPQMVAMRQGVTRTLGYWVASVCTCLCR